MINGFAVWSTVNLDCSVLRLGKERRKDMMITMMLLLPQQMAVIHAANVYNSAFLGGAKCRAILKFGSQWSSVQGGRCGQRQGFDYSNEGSSGCQLDRRAYTEGHSTVGVGFVSELASFLS